MNRFTGPQHAFYLRAFWKKNGLYTAVRRLYRTHFNLTSLKHVPSANLIKHWMCKFEETGNNTGQIVWAQKYIKNYHECRPRSSTASLLWTTHDSHSAIAIIFFRKPYIFTPNKIVIVQEMKLDNPLKRVEFCRIIKNRFRSFITSGSPINRTFTSTITWIKKKCRFRESARFRQAWAFGKCKHLPKVGQTVGWNSALCLTYF